MGTDFAIIQAKGYLIKCSDWKQFTDAMYAKRKEKKLVTLKRKGETLEKNKKRLKPETYERKKQEHEESITNAESGHHDDLFDDFLDSWASDESIKMVEQDSYGRASEQQELCVFIYLTDTCNCIMDQKIGGSTLVYYMRQCPTDPIYDIRGGAKEPFAICTTNIHKSSDFMTKEFKYDDEKNEQAQMKTFHTKLESMQADNDEQINIYQELSEWLIKTQLINFNEWLVSYYH